MINLIPEALRPTRVSPLPYLPLGGIALLCGIWLLIQFNGASEARKQLAAARSQYQKLQKQLRAFAGLPDKKARAEEEAERLRIKAALVTLLTRGAPPFTGILRGLAEATPKDLRLTRAVVDPEKGQGTLLGYGKEENADFEVSSFVRALNRQKAIQETFSGVRLDFCNRAKVGDRPVKKFAITLVFRREEPETAEPSEEDTPKGRRGRG